MRYVFRASTLDTAQYILYRAEGPIRLQPKVFQVLLYLLTHRDRVISKQTLMEQVWPEQFISDATLEGVIKAVRRAVGDDGRTQWCIQTRRGQGYQFVAPVRIVDPTASESHMPAALPIHTHPPASPSVAEPSGHEMPNAIRRQLTAMSCDIVEATYLSQRLDPEDLRELEQACQLMCQTSVERFEGTVEQRSGMGLIAFFGYPQAREDAAYRAVRAGLEIVEKLQAFNRDLTYENEVELSIRIGIHTGLVVTETSDRDTSPLARAVGAPFQVADQIQHLAEPGCVYMSAATAKLVQGLFICREAVLPQASALALPMPLFRVLRQSQAQSRFDAARSRGLAPLIGRDAEFGALQHRWEQACQGKGQVVLLYGEAGIGKSRLAEAFREQAEHQAHTWVVLRCASTAQQSALYPLLTLLRERLRWEPEAPADTKLDTLEALLKAHGLPLDEAVPLVAALLGIPLGERYTPIPLPPDHQRRKTLDTLMTWLLREAMPPPTLMIWEDIHWADPSTLEFLSLLLNQVATLPMLVLLTFRPVFQPPWPLRSYLTHLALDRLSREHVVQMIAHETGDVFLPTEVIQAVLAKSDGVPLFVEEFIKLILASDVVHRRYGRYILAKPLTDLAIPATLQDLLMARLDRLGPARFILQLGAMLGREFGYPLLYAVAPFESAELQHGLAQLVESELLYQQGVPPQAVYLFKHALIQDVAYQSILKRHRRQDHQRIAQVLEEQFLEITEYQPELLAHHFTEAEQPIRAVAYWLTAARAAFSRFAYMEAIEHSDAGIELLSTMPTTPDSIQSELILQCTLGMAHGITKGLVASEVEQAYGRALELCQQVGDSSQLLAILGGLQQYYFSRAEFRPARELAERQLSLAQRQKSSAFLIQAYANLGTVLFFLGEFYDARDKLQQGRSLLTTIEYDDVSEIRDSRVHCLSSAALALFVCGDVDQALRCSQEALNLAQALAQPFSLAFMFGWKALFHLLRREYSDAERYVDAGIALTHQYGFLSFRALGETMKRFILTAQGLGDNNLGSIHQMISAHRSAGLELLELVFLLLLAEAYQHAGHTEAGLSVVAEAQATMAVNGQYAFEAELYRVQGELLRQQMTPDVVQAESCFRQAIDVARRQQAKLWELRAVTSLCRLWQQQGKTKAAHLLLHPIYGRFTEGYDTPDLQASKAVLDALTSTI